VVLPVLATRNGFTLDFTNHLWLVWVQAHIASTGVPTYFIHTTDAGRRRLQPVLHVLRCSVSRTLKEVSCRRYLS